MTLTPSEVELKRKAEADIDRGSYSVIATRAEVLALLSTIERLRGALTTIYESDESTYAVGEIARAALQSPTPDDEKGEK